MDPEEYNDFIAPFQRNAQLQQGLRANKHLQELAQNMAAEDAMPKCPFCGGSVSEGFVKCRHCASDLKWLGGLPFKPGMSNKAMSSAVNRNQARAQAEAKAINEDILVRILSGFLILGIIIFAIWMTSE